MCVSTFQQTDAVIPFSRGAFSQISLKRLKVWGQPEISCSHDQRAGIDGRKGINIVWVSPVTYYASQ